jgi:hypothetical protein
MKMCHIFLTSGSYIERPQLLKWLKWKHIWYILDNSKLISQVKTQNSLQYAHAIYMCHFQLWILTREGIVWLEIIKYMYVCMYVFSIISCLKFVRSHAIQTKSVTCTQDTTVYSYYMIDLWLNECMNIIIFNICSIRVVLCANFISDLRSIPSTKGGRTHNDFSRLIQV